MMRKRNSVSVLLLAAVALTFINSPLYAADKTAPNLIIMYMDDLGWADTSVAMMDGEPLSKNDFYQTPHLEKLAARGIRFSNGYCPTPTCTGSRVSIQFGMTSARTQVRSLNDVLAKKQRGQNGWDHEISMAAVVKAANKNYITAHFGKGMNVRRMDHAGYDVTDEYDESPNGNAHGHYIDVNKKTPISDDNAKRIPDLTRLSLDFVKENAGKRPFYMMISHYAVHVPHQASPEAIERARKRWFKMMGKTDMNVGDVKYKKSKEYNTWQYAAMIEQCDEHLGILVEALEEAGELDNTYIIYTSDNGSGFNGSFAGQNKSSNGPLQGGKCFTFEGGLRIPFIVAGPGMKPGSQCDVPVVQWDLLATLHDLSGSKAPLPKGVDGGSLRDVFERGNKGTVQRGAPGLIFHYACHFHAPVSVIRIGDYKLMRHLNSGELKLFNVAKDYAEQNDLASKMPEKVKEMDRIRREYVDEVDGGEMDDIYAAVSEEFDRLRSLGEQKYLSSIEALRQNKPDDFEAQKAKLDAVWEKQQLVNHVKTEILKSHMSNEFWMGTSKQEVMKRLGVVDKKGTRISK